MATNNKANVPHPTEKVKPVPSDHPSRRSKRVRGPSHPQHRANGPFEAESFNKRTGAYLRTFHHTRAKAEKRLAGNHLHSGHKITDHTAMIEAAEREQARKAAKKAHASTKAQPVPAAEPWEAELEGA